MLYVGAGQVVVLCTGPGKRGKEFSGVVVSSEHKGCQVGTVSGTWSSKAFKEYTSTVKISNNG